MKTNLHAIAFVEQFHLLFLDQLGRKLDKRNYALKGGCNLRFFLNSIRYSEVMDLDVKHTPVNVLRDRVEQILEGKTLAQILQTRGIKITNLSAPKQTDTTQRWKISLSASGLDLPLHTRIEFSRRGDGSEAVFEPVDAVLMRDYQLTPFLASHYPPAVAFQQKVSALIHRAQTQARDIFDLDHLLRRGGIPWGREPFPRWEEAEHNALSISFDIFKAQVLSYLPPDCRAPYDDPNLWDEMVLRVIEAVKGGPG